MTKSILGGLPGGCPLGTTHGCTPTEATFASRLEELRDCGTEGGAGEASVIFFLQLQDASSSEKF